MAGFTKVVIVLKDATNHEDYNKRIIEYLTDRHIAINDNGYTIALEVVDDKNIDEYVRQGLESIPAIKVSESEEYVYGVNSILSTLAKLEIVQKYETKPTNKKNKQNESEEVNAFYKMALEEMKADEQDDPDSQSTVKVYQQDFSETPLTEKLIEEKAQAYNKIYEERNRRNKNGGNVRQTRSAPQSKKQQSGSINMDKIIESGGYDKAEEQLMRQIASNL